jgi:UDP-N-acetylmuramate--alanine ligase
MDLSHAQKIHVVGIGGIGISALAKFLLSQGKTLTGSDLHSSHFTQQLVSRGVMVHEGHHQNHLPSDAQFLVYSPAVPETNPERAKALSLGIPQCSYAQALGELSQQYSTIVVTGTHGKSTTTAMLGLILEAAGYDPTVIVGSIVPSFAEGNLRIGKGRFLVVEGCEHQANMLNLRPEMIVLTSIEEDHLDFYKNLENIRSTFQTFVDRLSGKGLVVVNADDPVSNTLTITNAVRYGNDPSAHYHVRDRAVGSGIQQAWIGRSVPQENLGTLTLKVPAAFNVANALAATAAAMELGIPFETCRRVLSEFPGIWRRFERVGSYKGVDVISDYGHHPTAIRVTLEAARELFPDKKLILCFQPHQHSRTQTLFGGFVDALSLADAVVLSEIYRVEGRTEDETVSSRHLANAVGEKCPNLPICYAMNFDEAELRLGEMINEYPESVLIIQGAGTIDELARKIVEKK